MLSKIATIICLLSLSVASVHASESCAQYELTDIKNSYDLAEIMGKNKIFDVDLMMKYDDNAPIPLGEVVLLEHRVLKTQVVLGKMNLNGEREYKIEGFKFVRAGKSLRSVASEKELVKFCKED